MKRSSHVTLGLLAAAAVAFTTGCRHTPERRDCVDEQNRIAGEQNCVLAEQNRSHGYAGYIPYHYMYGGSTGGHIGDAVINGNPAPGMSSGSHSGGTSRGGFGSFFGGGGSGGGAGS